MDRRERQRQGLGETVCLSDDTVTSNFDSFNESQNFSFEESRNHARNAGASTNGDTGCMVTVWALKGREVRQLNPSDFSTIRSSINDPTLTYTELPVAHGVDCDGRTVYWRFDLINSNVSVSVGGDSNVIWLQKRGDYDFTDSQGNPFTYNLAGCDFFFLQYLQETRFRAMQLSPIDFSIVKALKVPNEITSLGATADCLPCGSLDGIGGDQSFIDIRAGWPTTTIPVPGVPGATLASGDKAYVSRRFASDGTAASSAEIPFTTPTQETYDYARGCGGTGTTHWQTATRGSVYGGNAVTAFRLSAISHAIISAGLPSSVINGQQVDSSPPIDGGGCDTVSVWTDISLGTYLTDVSWAVIKLAHQSVFDGIGGGG